MQRFIATFYSHFGATRFKREFEGMGVKVTLMPVPRFLSSSCGTCALFEAEGFLNPQNTDEIEQIVRLDGETFDSSSFTVVFSSVGD